MHSTASLQETQMAGLRPCPVLTAPLRLPAGSRDQLCTVCDCSLSTTCTYSVQSPVMTGRERLRV